MLLPSDFRTELVEAILEQSSPSADFVAQQLETVSRRRQQVKEGASRLIPADEAHDRVLSSLKLRV